MYSRITLVGNLGADPEPGQTRDGKSMAKLRIATKASNKEGKTSWWYATAFRWSADFAIQYLKKGDQVLIDGEISMRDYEDKNGNKRQSVDIVVDRIKSMGKRERSNQVESSVNSDQIPF
tara:strand:+ start:2573 stop:2932 length:360 start_codon:yes stop_codon:yes gene_type:complete